MNTATATGLDTVEFVRACGQVYMTCLYTQIGSLMERKKKPTTLPFTHLGPQLFLCSPEAQAGQDRTATGTPRKGKEADRWQGCERQV